MVTELHRSVEVVMTWPVNDMAASLVIEKVPAAGKSDSALSTLEGKANTVSAVDLVPGGTATAAHDTGAGGKPGSLDAARPRLLQHIFSCIQGLGGQTSMSPAASELVERIRTRRARVGIVGLGYVGLPLALEFARVNVALGCRVLGQLTKRFRNNPLLAIPGYNAGPGRPVGEPDALHQAFDLRAHLVEHARQPDGAPLRGL